MMDEPLRLKKDVDLEIAFLRAVLRDPPGGFGSRDDTELGLRLIDLLDGTAAKQPKAPTP